MLARSRCYAQRDPSVSMKYVQFLNYINDTSIQLKKKDLYADFLCFGVTSWDEQFPLELTLKNRELTSKN